MKKKQNNKNKNKHKVIIVSDFLEKEPTDLEQKWRHVAEQLAEEVALLRDCMDSLVVDLLGKDSRYADNDHVKKCLAARKVNHE